MENFRVKEAQSTIEDKEKCLDIFNILIALLPGPSLS